jgi:hypothetical protein
MAWSQVQKQTGNGTGTTLPMAFPSNNVAGHMIIVVAQGWVSNPTTCTDSQGNTYTKVASGTSPQNWAIYVANNIKAGANTVTVNGLSSGWPTVGFIAEYSGNNPTASVATPVVGSSGSGSVSATVNVTKVGDLVVAVGLSSNNVTYSAATGFGDVISVSNSNTSIGMDDKASTATGNQSATISASDTSTVIGLVLPGTPLMSTLSGSLRKSPLDSTKWSTWGSPTPVGTTNGLTISTTATAPGSYGGILSQNFYDLTGSYMYVRLKNAGNTSLASLDQGIQFQVDSNNSLAWVIYGNQIQAKKHVAGTWTVVGTPVTYNPATHVYLRIREASGTIYWDYSADAITWTNFTSVANPFVITRGQAQINAGTDASEASTTTVTYDNFNAVVTTNVLTRSMKYTIFMHTTKSMQYEIRKTRTGLTKNLQYEVKIASEHFSKSVKYNLRWSNQMTKNMRYETKHYYIYKNLGYALVYTKSDAGQQSVSNVKPVTFKHRTLYFKLQLLDNLENVLQEKTVELTAGSMSAGSGGTRRKIAFDLLEPLSSDWQSRRWKAYYGYQEVTGGTIQYDSLGVFIPINPQEAEVKNGHVTSFQGSDKSKLFADYQLTAPYTFPAGTTVMQMFQTIAGWVNETKVKLAPDLGTTVVDYTFIEGTTAQTILDTIADAHGDEWHYDVDGYLVAEKKIAPNARSVKYVMDDPDVPLYITSLFNIDDSNYYNSVTVVGGLVNTDIFRSSAQDTAAIAAAGNRIVQKYFTVNAAVTQAMVDGLAASYLSGGVLLPRKLQLTNLVISDLDVGDIIMKDGTKYQVTSFDVPLGLGTQSIQAGEITS